MSIEATTEATQPAESPAATPTQAKKTAAKKAAAPAAKPSVKPAARPPTKKVSATPAAKQVTAAVTKKPAKAEAPAAAPKAVKVKAKLVRDSFTMPRADFALIDALKDRALAFKRPAKKSELLRAGLHALSVLNNTQLKAALEALTPLKPGRPKQGE